MRRPLAALFLALAAPAWAQIDVAQVRETTLENGLRLLVLEDHSTPTFTIMLWVPAGGRTERAGITGISHFIEHLYSMGSSRLAPREVDEFVARHGGQKNAFTTADYTAYYEQMPVDTLDEVLSMEADRFSTLAIPQDKIDSERQVVMEERRMRYETGKFGPLWLAVQTLGYTTHTYGIPVIGTMDDLHAIARDQIVQYHRLHYTTENVNYILVGDFAADDAIAAFRRHFGGVARAARPPAPNIAAEPPQTSERRRTIVREDIRLPAFETGWVTVGIDHADYFPLKMLEAYLANGQTGLLERRLQREEEMATTTGTYQYETIDPGLFIVQAEARPGVAVEDLERAVYDLIEEVKADGPDPEQLDIARSLFEVSFLQGMQTTQDKASQLGTYQTISREGFRFLGHYIERLRAVTPEQVQEVARRYLRGENRNVVTQVPAAGVRWEDFGAASRAVLPNGLTAVVENRPGVPAAAICVMVKAGSRYDPPGRSGLARLTSDAMQAGTTSMDEEEVLNSFAALGTSLGSQTLHDTIAYTSFVRSEDLGRAVGLVADVLRNPAFDEAKFEEIRDRLVADRESARDNPQSLLVEQFYAALYGMGHPYGPPIDGAVEDLRTMTADEVRAFHERAYRPERTVVVIVGAVDRDAVGAFLARSFADWPAGADGAEEEQIAPPQSAAERITVVNVPGMPQAYIRMGHPGIARRHEDFDVLLLANQVLGGSGMTSRLMQDVRTEHGYVYDVWSNVFARELGGAFAIQLMTKNESVGDALRLCLQHADRIRTEAAPAEELTQRQDQFGGELPFRMEKVEDRARLWAEGWLFGLGADYLDRQIAAVRAATAEQVRAAAERHVHPDQLRIVIVGDLTQFQQQLEGLGTMRVVNRE